MRPAGDFLPRDDGITPPPTEQSPQQVVDNSCAAYGCPLAGSVQAPNGKWYCRFHSRSAHSENDAITSVLRANVKAIKFYDQLTRLSAVEFHQQRSQFEGAKFPSKPGESMQSYLNRVNGWIQSQIRKALGSRKGEGGVKVLEKQHQEDLP